MRMDVEEANSLMERIKSYMVALSELTTGPDKDKLVEDITTVQEILASPSLTSFVDIDADNFIALCKQLAMDELEREDAELSNVIFWVEMAESLENGTTQIILKTED